MIGILVISHEPLGTAMIHCTRHIFGRMPPQLAALDVIPDEDPERALAAARNLVSRINDGSGVIVMTDVFGATPSRIAAQLGEPMRVVVVAGVNLPLLVRALTRRKGREVGPFVDELLPAARDAIMQVPADMVAELDPASKHPGVAARAGSPDGAADA
jgi:PTS system ascorbate-specific IIA component